VNSLRKIDGLLEKSAARSSRRRISLYIRLIGTPVKQLNMVRLCTYCNRPMLHKYIIGTDHLIYINDHDSRSFRSGAERFLSPLSTYECPDCEVFLIDRNDPSVTYQKKMKCPSCGKNHYYTNKDWNSDSIVICKSCLSEFILEVD
jgi:predicted RNA-binding Zn-ribbon protein involved in translation (DUF1610 family)